MENEEIQKLVICCPYYFFFRGYNAAMTQRILNLARNHKLILLTREDVIVPDEIKQKSFFLYKHPLKRKILRNRLILSLSSLLVLFRIYATYKFDAFYTIHTYTIFRGFVMMLFTRAKWVIDIVDDPALPLRDFSQGKNRLDTRYIFLKMRDLFFKALMKHADLVVAMGSDVDGGLPKSLVDSYRVRPEKILPVPNGIDLQKITAKKRSGNGGAFRIFYVGYVSKLRGIETLLLATKNIAARIPGAKTVLVGSAKGEDYNWLYQTINLLDLGKHVEYFGEKKNEEVLSIIEDSDVCIYPFPKRSELSCVYPIKVFEYLALEKPVVATELDAIKKIIRDGYNGLLVQPDNVEEMADAIYRIYSDKELRGILQNNARSSLQTYDWGNINNKINRALTECCSSDINPSTQETRSAN